jgi:hypothetical protein
MKIQARKLTKKSLFKLILISYSIPFFLFFLLCGIASIFGAETVKWNKEPITGIMGLFAALLMYPIFCLVFSCFAWVASAFGLWVYSKFKKLDIEFVDAEVISTEQA